ncbi:hypothetical protein JKF63_00718 [Porcisia hertigi]|uniref:Uncharacterized protein n=1 Tax=Porcisia hertigi TaxID=2761500 RepID=A0A836KYK8_9TRYP|nr:hypothetical protein JKF63_00718 [Porcisia hertigi]
MRRAGFPRAATTAFVTGRILVSQLLVSPTLSSSSSSSSGLCGNVSAQCCLYHTGGLFARTPLVRFDLRKHEMEKRRRRELEKAGIDPADDDDAPWIAPEEQQRLEEEEEQQRAEKEAQRQAFLKKRAEEEIVKRQKFKEFRARQIAMSRQRKESMAEKKEEGRQHRQRTSRVETLEDEPAEDGLSAAVGGDDVENAPARSTH